MKIYYQNREVGALGRMGTNTYIFTIKTHIMHRTIEYKAKNLKDAEKKAQDYLNQLVKNVRK